VIRTVNGDDMISRNLVVVPKVCGGGAEPLTVSLVLSEDCAAFRDICPVRLVTIAGLIRATLALLMVMLHPGERGEDKCYFVLKVTCDCCLEEECDLKCSALFGCTSFCLVLVVWICTVFAAAFLCSWTLLASKDVPRGEECCDTTLIFLEYEIVAMGRRSMHGDVSSCVSVQVIPRVLNVQRVVIPLKFTFTAPTLLKTPIAHLKRSCIYNKNSL
jgi:hypothetical protein